MPGMRLGLAVLSNQILQPYIVSGARAVTAFSCFPVNHMTASWLTDADGPTNFFNDATGAHVTCMNQMTRVILARHGATAGRVDLRLFSTRGQTGGSRRSGGVDWPVTEGLPRRRPLVAVSRSLEVPSGHPEAPGIR